jgi:hypothetical protein
VEPNQQVEQNVTEGSVPDLLPGKPWDPAINYLASLNWLTLSPIKAALGKGIKFYALEEVLGEAKIEGLCKKAHLFKGDIWVSENFVGHNSVRLSPQLATPFTKKQKPIQEVLVIKKGEDNYSVGLIDQREAAFWREKLKDKDSSYPVALFDVSSNTVVCSHKGGLRNQDLQNSASFQRTITRLKFLKGSTTYTRLQQKMLKAWLIKDEPSEMKALFHLLHKDFGVSAVEGSVIEAIFSDIEDID